MGKLALEKPVAKPSKPVIAANIDLANTDFRSGTEPLQLLSPIAFKQPAPDEISGLTDKLWQPMIQATLEQVGQTLLDWCWKAFEQRYGEQLKHLNTARALSSQLLDPQLSLQAKCTTLLNVLETSTLTGGSITPYLDVARQLKTIFNGLQQPGSGVIKRGIDTLNNLLALLDLPAAQQIAGKGTLSPVRDLLSGVLDWAQTLQRLSNVSWDSPQAIVDGLLQSGALPTWVTEIVAQGQKLYETLSSRLTAIQHKGKQLQRLQGLLAQFNEAVSTKAKFTALLTLLLDEDMLGLIEQYAPAAMGDGLKAFALFKNALRDGGEQNTTGLRSTLLSMEHVTSQPFIDRLGSEAGAVGQLMAEPLGNIRTALRGSASQEAAFNLLLGLTDPKKTWSDFLLESSREMLLLPQVQDLGASFVSRFAWQAQAIKALYRVLDDTFWAQYKTAGWAELPALISDTALRDAQNKQSQLAIALSAASGIPGQHIQTVFTEVSRVCHSWGNDSWPEFLPKVTESVNNLLSVLVQHGQVLPTYVQTLLDIGLWAAKGITRLLMLHAVWKAKADDEVLGEATLALIRKAIEEYAGDNAAWGFDKAVIWLPMLPPLYKVLGNLEPIKEGQRVQWLANLLMRLYSLPEAQNNKDIIWVREQIEAKAEQWLGGIPAAMLGKAIVEEIQSKPGYDLTPMFTRAIQLQGLVSYISDCFTNVTNALQEVDVMAGAKALLNPAHVQGLDVMAGMTALLNPARVHEPGRQRPAYLRDLTTLNFVLPDDHPQQPLSTTPQNIAPFVWGGAAGATFVIGIMCTYFAYKNYRKGNQTPSQADNDLDEPLEEPDNTLDVDELSNTTENIPLNRLPYNTTTVPLSPKNSHWKKTSSLAAMASVMFGASAFFLWQTYNAAADNNAREKITELEALEAKARKDFYAGSANTLSDDVTEFLEILSHFEIFNVATAPPETTAAPEMEPQISIQWVNQFQDQPQRSLHGPAVSNDIPYTLSRVPRSPLKIPNQGISIDNVLPLMREAQVLIETIMTQENEGKTQSELGYLYGRLGAVKLELTGLRDFISHLTPDSSGQLLTNREVYAYYLLAEMKSYYSNEEAQLLWGNFAPYTNVSFHYQDTQGQPQRSSARLIEFLNGDINDKLDRLGAEGSFTFSSEQELSPVAEQLRLGTAHYIPGNWTKEKELNKLYFYSHQAGQNMPPRMSDPMTLRIHPQNPFGESTGSVREINLTLDTYFMQVFTSDTNASPYDRKEIIWPKHYTPVLQRLLSEPTFVNAYCAGVQTVAELNERIEELRKQKTEAYDKKIKTYSGDDVLSNSELITQYSWQDLIFENNGTPIGFIEDDVINRAIVNVEARILHYEKQRDQVVNAPEWQQDFQSEIEKLMKVLSILHQKQGNSERMEAESLSGVALFDKHVEAFAAILWTQPEYQNRLKQHPQLSRLTPESILSVQITQGTQITHTSLPLHRILAGEHERLGTSGSTVTVNWPSELTTSDTLLHDLISECKRYRKSLDIGLETKNAIARINIPTIDHSLQQGLEQVFAQTPSAQKKQGTINLRDKVNVRFFPTTNSKKRIRRFAPAGMPYMVAAEPVVNKEYTLKEIMGKAPETKFLGMTFYNRVEVDTEGKYPKEIIDALQKVDWQRKLQDNIDKLRNDKKLKDDWRLVFSPLISNTIGRAGASRVNTVQLNSVSVPGVYKIAHTNGSIELHSIFSSESWKFKSAYDLSIALDTAGSITSTTSNPQPAPDTEQNNHQLYTWLNEHQEQYYKQNNIGGNYLTSVNPDETANADRVADLAFDDFISSLYSDADTWLKSDSELTTQRRYKFFINVIAPIIELLTKPVTGPLAYLISAGLAAIPFGELIVADTQEEFREIAMNAAIAAAFSLGSEVVMGGLSKIPAQKIITAITKKLSKKPAPRPGSGLAAQLAPAELQRLEPFRHSPVGKIGNLEAGTEQYLIKLKENRAILNAIDCPDGTCANLLSIVGPRISQADIGMTDIKYRGLLIWNNAMEIIPSNHFVVLGSKNGQRYVFDLSARQFHNKGMPDLDGPLILKEAEWVQKYSNATTRKLIKYKDFDAPDSATNSFRSLPGLFSPGDLIEDGILLTMPQWYKTLTHWNPSRSTQNFSQGAYGRNAPREAAQALNSSTGSNSRWDYAIEVLRDADMLTPSQAQNLTTGLIAASNNRGFGSSGRIDNLLSDIRTVNTAEELLRVRKGELVVFMHANSSAPEKGHYPVHIVTSLGNGRFAGVQNSLINPALGDHKGIFNAEQLASFIRTEGLPGTPTLEIKAGFPMGYKSPYASSLTEAASSAARVVDTDVPSAQYVSRTLELSGDLAYEQAQALKNAAIILAEPSGAGSGITIDKIMKNPQKLTTLEALKSVPKGHIVATTSSPSNVSHLMLSLGNARFATSGLNSLNPDLPHAKSIVTAEQLYRSMQDGTLGGLDLQSGPVNINNLRADALRMETDPTLLPKGSAQPPNVSTSATSPKITNLTFNNHNYKITATPLKNKTTLYSVADDPADAISVSSHGEYSLNSATMKAPDDMSIEFLAPHDWALQNTGGTGFFNVESGMRPHSTVSDGGNTIVFSPRKASDDGNNPSVQHTHNTVLLDATGTTKPNQIMDYTLAHFPFELPQDIMSQIALNRELVKLKQPNVRKTDYLTIDLTSDNTSFSSVIAELKQLPVPPKTVTAVFCRSLRPSTTYSYNPMGENSGASHIIKGHQNTYDITGSKPVLKRSVLVILSRPLRLPSGDGSNRNTSNTTVNERDVTVIAGPLKNDIWQKKSMWINGLAFSQFEALDDSGSIHLADSSSNFITLTAKEPIVANRWLLEWSINTGPTQDRKGSRTHSTMEAVLENIGPLVSALTAHNCTYRICTGAQNRVLAAGSINQKVPLSWLGNLQYGQLNLNISYSNAEHDEKLRSFTGDKLNQYFSTYMLDKNFISGFNTNALDIVDFLLKYHAIKHPETLQAPVNKKNIEDTFTELFMSQPIAEVLAYMLMANEPSNNIAPGSSPFSRKQISSFIRALTESAFKVLNFDVNDDGLHRGTMAARFESDKAQLVNGHNLRPALAAYLIAIRYMDADIDKILSKTKKTYPASSTLNGEPYRPYQKVGTITAKKDEHGRYTTLTRDNRAKVSLYKSNTLIFEKTYEIPPRYRGSMMSRYIANAISVEMNQQRFDVSVQHPSSIVAGVREGIYSQQGLRGYQVIPSYEREISIYSDINQKNPGNNFKVVVIFV